MYRTGAAIALLVIAGCGGESGAPPVRPDTAPGASTVLDTAGATALRDSATATLATLLQRPETAAFDSVVVVQPRAEGARTPPMAVCGRIGGAPGIKGSAGPARFVYQSKWALYVEDNENREQFAEVWANLCAASGAAVVLR